MPLQLTAANYSDLQKLQSPPTFLQSGRISTTNESFATPLPLPKDDKRFVDCIATYG